MPHPPAQATNEEVYNETLRDLVSGVLYGINTTVFAYGATGSGKTYTMVGEYHNLGHVGRCARSVAGKALLCLHSPRTAKELAAKERTAAATGGLQQRARLSPAGATAPCAGRQTHACVWHTSGGQGGVLVHAVQSLRLPTSSTRAHAHA